MNWFLDLFRTGSVAGSVLILAVVASAGLLLGSIHFRGIDLGITGVLFAGLLLGHFGVAVDHDLLEFIRDFGLVLFVYAVGVQVGPRFLASLRQQGTALNLIAAGTVALGCLIAIAIGRFAHIDIPATVGMLSGATTNTPSLGAAQAALRDLPTYTDAMGQLPALAYAMAYPFGILGIILAMILTRPLFARKAPPSDDLQRATVLAGRKETNDPPTEEPLDSVDGEEPLQVFPVFLAIALGVVIGSIPMPIRGLPAPLRLGLAGGPLIVAIALSAPRRILGMTWRMSSDANTLVREIGIVLFLSSVGLMSGGRFIETLINGDGLRWMAWATLITFIPMVLAAFAGRWLADTDYPTTCGMMAGSMTDPPALAFAWSSTQSAKTTVAYATVYPLTMVMRIMSTQLIVLLLMR